MIRLQEVKPTIDQYERLIHTMVSQSNDVPPLTMRSKRQTRAMPVIALCSYKQGNVCSKCLFVFVLCVLHFSMFSDHLWRVLWDYWVMILRSETLEYWGLLELNCLLSLLSKGFHFWRKTDERTKNHPYSKNIDFWRNLMKFNKNACFSTSLQ